jgi:AcrR family transcriptional regulator
VSEPATTRAVGDRRASSKGDAQRARIIDALVELLRTHPISEVSVQGIAKQAGITRPTFYVYFESKYTVLAAAVDDVWKQFAITKSPMSAVDPRLPPAEMTRRLTGNAVRVWGAHHRLIAAALEARSSDDQLARLWDGLLEQNCEQIRGVLELLRAAGRIRPASDDLTALVEALFGMTVWSLVNSTWTDEGPDGNDSDSNDPDSDDPDRRPADTAREHLIEVISAIWLVSIWGISPDSDARPGGRIG